LIGFREQPDEGRTHGIVAAQLCGAKALRNGLWRDAEDARCINPRVTGP
jgi:hypothetical protein